MIQHVVKEARTFEAAIWASLFERKAVWAPAAWALGRLSTKSSTQTTEKKTTSTLVDFISSYTRLKAYVSVVWGCWVRLG